MKNAGERSGARLLAKTFLVYASYWYLAGPAFGVSLQLYINYRFGLVKLLGDATYPDIICVSSCIVLMSYIAATFVRRTGRRRNAVAVAATVCGMLAMLGMELPGMLGVTQNLLRLGAALLFSIYFMSHLLMWFEVFACHDSMLVLVYVLVLSSLAGCLCWFLIGLSGPRLVCAQGLVVLFGALMLFKSFRSTSELNSPQSAMRGLTRPLVWLLAVTFVFGLGYMYTTSVMSLENFHNVFDWTNIVYGLVVCAVVLVFSRRIRISMLFYLAAPITIAGILLTLFRNPFSLSPSILSNVGFFTYLVFVLVLYCAISREHNTEPLRASCLLTLSLYAGLLAGRQLFSAMDGLLGSNADADVASVFHAPLEVGIVVLLVVCTMIGMRIIDEIVSNELSRPQLAHITTYEVSEASAHIAAIYRLSERECEVLSLLLENKSATEVADAMVIAHGTAKAHISNIYKKLGIHTREELFAMVPGGTK